MGRGFWSLEGLTIFVLSCGEVSVRMLHCSSPAPQSLIEFNIVGGEPRASSQDNKQSRKRLSGRCKNEPLKWWILVFLRKRIAQLQSQVISLCGGYNE